MTQADLWEANTAVRARKIEIPVHLNACVHLSDFIGKNTDSTKLKQYTCSLLNHVILQAKVDTALTPWVKIT